MYATSKIEICTKRYAHLPMNVKNAALAVFAPEAFMWRRTMDLL